MNKEGFLKDLPEVEKILEKKHRLIRMEKDGSVIFKKEESPESIPFTAKGVESVIKGKGAEVARDLREKNKNKADEMGLAKKNFRI